MNSKVKQMKSPAFILTSRSSGVRQVVTLLLATLLFMQTAIPPAGALARKASPAGAASGNPAPVTADNDSATAARSLKAIAATDNFGIVLTAVSTTFNDIIGIDYHQPANKVVVSVNQPSGQPRNFEMVAADGAHSGFSNVAGLTGELKIATARDDGEGISRGGFAPGELFVGTGAPGVVARVAADGSTIRNPWITLPNETGLLGGLYVDRTGVFAGDLIVVTTQGGVWRINSSGQAALVANLGARLEGVTTVPNDPDRYGPWAGKILAGAEQQGKIYSIDPQGGSASLQLGINPQDIRLIPAHENFYGVDLAGRKLWGAPDAAFTGMIGDVLVAQESPGALSRVRWNGSEFEVAQLAQVTQWKQITFSPAGVAEIPAVKRFYDQIAVVRHAPVLNSGRIEGALWQLTGESLTLDGNDTITSDLLVPGRPAVGVIGEPSFNGVIEGTGATQPSGYTVTITGNASLRHLLTRTDPIALLAVAPPPAPAGTRDVSLQQAGESAGDWATVRNLTISGKAGSVAVPPGTYGRFAASGRNAFVFGSATATQPDVYNLDELTLSGGSELRLDGPVILTVRGNVTLTGSTAGAADNPRRMLLKVAQGEVKVSGNSVLYAITRAPQSAITIEGNGRLRGTVSCDRLTVDGNGVLQITENDIPPPPVNRPPSVDAGPDQTITLPTNTISLSGAASDDGLPQGGALSVSWTKATGPGAVSFSSPNALTTNATFTDAGTYVLRLTASDTLLTASDEVTITVIPRNQPPVVNAGPDQTITLPEVANLSGEVSDDALPRGSVVTVSWSKTSGPGAVTFSNPAAAMTTAAFGAPGVYTLRLTASDTDLTASDEVVITVNPEPPNATLTLDPSLAGPNVTGASQTMRATLKKTDGAPIAGVSVQFAVTGANATSGVAATDSAGVASFIYQGNNSGADLVQATANVNGRVLQSNTASVNWVTPAKQISTTTVYGRFFTSDGSGVFTARPDQKPVFDKSFPTINFNPPAGTVPGAPSSVNVNSRPMADVTTDLNGNYTGSIVAEGASEGGSFLAGVGPLYTFNAVFTGAFTVAAAGDVTFRFFSDDGFIFGVGGGATRVSGANTNPPSSGRTPFENLPVMGAYNVPTAPVGNLVTVHFPAPGTYPYELDYSECCGGELVLTMTTAVNTGGYIGVPPTSSLTLTPNAVADQAAGGSQTFNVLAQDASGAALVNHSVLFTVKGVNSQSFTTTTDATGRASFAYTGTYPGTDIVEAAAFVGSQVVYSNVVSLRWTTTASSPIALSTPGWIGGPVHQSIVTGSVPIVLGNVSLFRGTIDYWPISNPQNITTLTTTAGGGPGSTVATLDTTLLANGSYIIRLRGTDTSWVELISQVLITVAGDYKPGRMTVSVTDLTVPVAGLPITIGRIYDSLERNRVSDFGHGWSLTVGARLEVNPANDVTITEPGTGRRVTFKFTPQSFGGIVGFMFFPSYTPEPGVYGKLTSDGCGLLAKINGEFRCFLGERYQPTTYTYTDVYGRVYTIGADGQMRSIKDLNDNLLTFTPTGITSSAGNLSVPFVRDAQGRITQITDPTGKIFRYNYDAAGNLATVNLPGILTPVAYTYDANHLFLSARDPRGNTEQTATYYADGRLASATDAVGNTTRYEYDLAARTTRQINPDGGIEIERYDATGLLLSETNATGHTTTYTYDANRNKLSETNALNQTMRYTYDASGNITSITDPQGRVIRATYNQFALPATDTDALGNVRTLSYDDNGSLVGISDSLGNLVTFTYDSVGNPISHTDGNGKTTRYAYDQYGNALTETDPLNRTTSFTYDLMGRVVTTTDPRGAVTSNTYDSLGRLLSVTDALGRVTQFEYDANGNRTAQVDALGRRTIYTYDAANRLTKVTFPDNTFITYAYNFRDQKISETDQAGRTTQFEYDKAGRLVKTTYPDGAMVVTTYDAIGRVIATTDERNNTTRYEYDPSCACNDRVTKITDALGRITQYEFDAAGRRITFTDAKSNVTRYAYDARHRLTQITFADNTTIRRSYDGANRLLTKTDQSSRVTRYAYDDAGDLISVTDARNQVTSYSYDAARNLLTQTDANNRTTRFEYDSMNRRTKRTLPLGQFETYAYDTVGSLQTRTDFNGKRTTYAYDLLNRLLSKTPDATLGEPAVSFTYTPTGRRATMTDASGTTTYTYDGRDRLTSKQTPQGTLTYTYDSANNLLTMRSSNANGVSVDYTYDALNRLETVKDNRLAAGTTTYSYDAVGNLTGEMRPNGVQSVYAYNSVNRLTNLTLSKAATLASYAYTLAPTGHRLSVTEHTGRTVNYAYDEVYRLTSETITGAPVSTQNGAVGYTLDAVGNRTTRSSTLAALAPQSFAYDANDRITTDTYDNNGNTTGANGRTFSYNFENRIKSANGGAITIVYDGDGNRVAKTVGGVTTKYLVDDLNPTGYAQVVEEIVGGNVQRTYTYGNALISQTQLIGSQWQTSFYGYDGSGSVRLLTNSAGNVTDTWDYDAFGNIIARTGTTPNNYLYRGEQFDTDLGIYFLRARYCDQQRGRFISMDEFDGFLDEPLSLHKYLYANADPVNFRDPSGFATLSDYAVKVRAFVARQVAALKRLAQHIACVILKTASVINPALELTASLIEFFFCKCKTLGGGAVVPKIPSIGALSKLGREIDRGGLTRAGRSLAKHAQGKRAGSSAFPAVKGTPSDINSLAQTILDDILGDPTSITKVRPGKGGEMLLQINKTNGTGVIYKQSGCKWSFSHFAENLY